MQHKLWKKAEKVSSLLALLSNPLRLLIICLLLKKELCATELLEILGTTKGNISQHLKLLYMEKLITKRKEGNRIYYSIADKNLKAIISCLSDCYCKDMKTLPIKEQK